MREMCVTLTLSFPRHFSAPNGTLKIHDVQEGDEGSYQCVAENDKDMSLASGSLQLGGTCTAKLESLISSRVAEKKVMAAVGFEPTPPKRLVP